MDHVVFEAVRLARWWLGPWGTTVKWWRLGPWGTTVNVRLCMAIGRDMAIASAPVTFEYPLLAKATCFDELPFARLRLDAEEVGIPCFCVKMRLEVIRILLLLQMSEMRRRSARTV